MASYSYAFSQWKSLSNTPISEQLGWFKVYKELFEQKDYNKDHYILLRDICLDIDHKLQTQLLMGIYSDTVVLNELLFYILIRNDVKGILYPDDRVYLDYLVFYFIKKYNLESIDKLTESFIEDFLEFRERFDLISREEVPPYGLPILLLVESLCHSFETIEEYVLEKCSNNHTIITAPEHFKERLYKIDERYKQLVDMVSIQRNV